MQWDTEKFKINHEELKVTTEEKTSPCENKKEPKS